MSSTKRARPVNRAGSSIRGVLTPKLLGITFITPAFAAAPVRRRRRRPMPTERPHCVRRSSRRRNIRRDYRPDMYKWPNTPPSSPAANKPRNRLAETVRARAARRRGPGRHAYSSRPDRPRRRRRAARRSSPWTAAAAHARRRAAIAGRIPLARSCRPGRLADPHGRRQIGDRVARAMIRLSSSRSVVSLQSKVKRRSLNVGETIG